jgi:hypothetical protein
MHTSTRMGAGDFQFWHHTASGARQVDFAAFCPDYHELDRVGVVSPALEDGVLQTSYALLALTTAFYDCLRARYLAPNPSPARLDAGRVEMSMARSQDDGFFDYPQHFAFVGAEGANVYTGSGLLPLSTPQLWDGWSWLDVWPDAK